jgi:hypothetical protein
VIEHPEEGGEPSPKLQLHETGDTPPEIVAERLTEEPASDGLGSVWTEETRNLATTAIECDSEVAVIPAESFTVTVTLYVPEVVYT